MKTARGAPPGAGSRRPTASEQLGALLPMPMSVCVTPYSLTTQFITLHVKMSSLSPSASPATLGRRRVALCCCQATLWVLHSGSSRRGGGGSQLLLVLRCQPLPDSWRLVL